MIEYRGFLCCNQRINPLNIMASKAELIAPINVKTGVLRSIPNKINVPNPPAPINAAKVAVPMIKTKAVRIPEIMTGNAMGSSTFSKRLILDIPNATAASSIDGSISARPMYVFWKIGSKA